MMHSAQFPITPESFDHCWESIDRLRRKSRRMRAIALFGGFFTNLYFLFALLLIINGLIYSHFQGTYHAFLSSLPLFPELWAEITAFALRPGDTFAAEAGKLLLCAYGSSVLVFILLALVIALVYHPLRKRLPEGNYEDRTSLLAKAAQEAWHRSYNTKISTSIASTLLVIVAAFILLFAYIIYRQDANAAEALLSIFPTHDPYTNCLLYVFAAYFVSHFFSTILLLVTRFIYRYQFPYELMAQAEAAALFAREESEGLTPEEIATRRKVRAAEIREEALSLETEAAYQKAKKMLHEAALMGDVPAMEHFARHCILSHLNDTARYWLKRCIASGEADKEAVTMLFRLRLHLNHRVQYLRTEAAPLSKWQKFLRVLKITVKAIWHIFIMAMLLFLLALCVLLYQNNFDPAVLENLPRAFSQLFH